ncbi:methyltransferase domain-containing protein [Hellea sp.]|nr:methyltransferase domain-containing protein [Hellea sp.]
MTQWYDVIAGVYDHFSQRHYKQPRKVLVDRLDLKSGDNVLHIGCGTGLSFSLIIDKIGPDGTLIGLDVSQKMLAQAEKKISKHGWQNVHLLHADARELSAELLKDHLGQDMTIDHAVGELSFSVMPDWRLVMENALGLIKDGGKFGVLDGYRAKKDWINSALNFLPQSNISRPISDYLCELTQECRVQTFGRYKIIFVAIGTKAQNLSNDDMI